MPQEVLTFPVKTRTVTKTAETTDSSVYLSADTSTQTEDVEKFVDITFETTPVRQDAYYYENATLDAGKSAFYSYAYDADRSPTAYVTAAASDHSSSAIIDWGYEGGYITVSVKNGSTKTLTFSITVTVTYTASWEQVGTASAAVSGVPAGWDSYTLSDYLVMEGDWADMTVSDDGQTVTMSGWRSTEFDRSAVVAWVKIHCTNQVTTGYSGLASAPYEGQNIYDIEVEESTGAIFSAGTPYVSESNINCWCYGNYGGYGEITFSYKYDTEEKYFAVNVDGIDVDGINIDGVDLDPNA